MNISLFYTIQNLQIDERQLSKFLYFGFCKIWKLATIKISIWCILYGFAFILEVKFQISIFRQIWKIANIKFYIYLLYILCIK